MVEDALLHLHDVGLAVVAAVEVSGAVRLLLQFRPGEFLGKFAAVVDFGGGDHAWHEGMPVRRWNRDIISQPIFFKLFAGEGVRRLIVRAAPPARAWRA